MSRYLHRLFELADEDGSGALDHAEMSKLLKSSGLQLTGKQVREVMGAVDVDHNGMVEYREFVPLMLSLIGVDMSDKMVAEQLVDKAKMFDLSTHSQEVLETYLSRLFFLGDTNRNGVLEPDEMRSVLRMSGFNFTDVFI